MNKYKLLFKSLLVALFILYSFNSFAQVKQEWVARFDGTYSDEANDIVTDAWGNVYVTGFSIRTDIDGDILTIKYNSKGEVQWTARYNGGAGNIFDVGYKILLDLKGNVFVAGYSNADYVTIKYDNNGNEQWVRRYSSEEYSYDQLRDMALDNAGNVYVTGFSFSSLATSDDIVTIKYDTEGNELWKRIYNSANNGSNYPLAIAVDKSANVFVGGNNLTLIKYNNEGEEDWVKSYMEPDNLIQDQGTVTDIVVNDAGDIFLTGVYTKNSNRDYLTIKYSTDGNLIWSAEYDGKADGFDTPLAIVINNSDEVYVTGKSAGEEGYYDYATIKYDSTGKQVWVRIYEGHIYDIEGATSMTIDKSGNIYVTGVRRRMEERYNYTTIKYDSDGNEKWIVDYNDPDNRDDYANKIVVDDIGNVYVTGRSEGNNNYFNYATIKYSQTETTPLLVDAGKDKTIYLGYGSNCKTIYAKVSGGTAPYTYSWTNDNSTSTEARVCPTTTTSYQLTVTDANGNKASDEVTINVIDLRCGNNNDKVMVCHKGKLLCISKDAVDNHLKHGDKLGMCSVDAGITQAQQNISTEVYSSTIFKASNTPNPFITSTNIQYILPVDGRVQINVFDVLGREVNKLVDAKQKAGNYITSFQTNSKGIYYYRITLTTPNKTYQQTGKMIRE